MAQMGISTTSSQQLTEISQTRKSKDALVSTKKGIVEEAIDIIHQRECKQVAKNID